MIRILFTIPNFDTAGSGKALLNIALGLDRSKFEPHIACKTDQGSFFEVVKKSGIPMHVFNYEATMRPLKKLLHESWKIAKKLREIKPDIIHSFHYNNNYGEALPAKLAGVKWIFTKKNMNWGSDGANAWKIRSFLADAIIIQNSEMQRQFYPNSKKTTLIERGIDIQKFAPQAKNPALKSTLNTPDNGRVIICVANMQPIKGLEVLIDAFLKLEPKFDDWHLWLVGDDSTQYGLELHKKVSRLDMQHKVHFSGKQPDVLPFLQHAEIFVLPTLATGEGSPVALIEAMTNGKIVLGSDAPGIKDQLAHVPQHLFPAGNVEMLAESLQKLMTNTPEVNAILGNSFRKYAIAKYDLKREVTAHEAVYKLVKGIAKSRKG